MSLFDILGVSTENGGLKAVGDWLQKSYVENEQELARMAHARLLDEFYEGGGDDEMIKVINTMYGDQKNRDRRIAVIRAELDKYDNIMARIVNEKATVYSEPARRKVKQNDEVYQRFCDLVQMDASMGSVDRLLALHGCALAWYRVRQTPTGEREPLLEAVSPASFWAVCHPKDRTLLIAVIFDQRMPQAGLEAEAYRVWTHDQTFVMNAKCEIFRESIESWPLGVMPGVLASIVKPGAGRQSLLEYRPSTDLLSAQKAIRLQAINLAKESISVTRQVYASGDMSTATMGQTSDTEGEILVPEGTNIQAIDRGVDQEQFRDNGGYVGDAVASNHGLAPSVLRNRDASSGAEIELRMRPLREQRKKRIPIMRTIERQLAVVMSKINGARVMTDETGEPAGLLAGDLPDFSFDAEGWSIDFGEVQQPMSAMESLQVFEKERELGARDNYEWEMQRNPDVKTIEDAKKIVDERNKRRGEYMESQKDFMAASGVLGAAQPITPFEANRGKPPGPQEDDAAA